jgi:hypothetical protein
MSGRWAVALVAAVGLAAAGAAAYAVAGPSGLAVLLTVLAIAALLAARLAMVPAAPGRPRRKRGTASGVTAEDFPAFRQIVADLGWAGASRRHYDHVTRPVFARLLRAALEDGRLTRQEAEARVGADLWPLIDPSAPLSDDSEISGVDAAAVGRVVDRLERLWPGRDGYDVGS